MSRIYSVARPRPDTRRTLGSDGRQGLGVREGESFRSIPRTLTLTTAVSLPKVGHDETSSSFSKCVRHEIERRCCLIIGISSVEECAVHVSTAIVYTVNPRLIFFRGK